jgi:hypothetical protein
MHDQIKILSVERGGNDGLIVAFSDKTTGVCVGTTGVETEPRANAKVI